MQKKVTPAVRADCTPNQGFLVVGGPVGLSGTRLVWGSLILAGEAKPVPRASHKGRS